MIDYRFWNSKYLIITSSIVAYLLIGYCIKREQFNYLAPAYFVAFCSYLLLLKKDYNNNLSLKIGIFFRCLLLFSIPTLSQDFYRFIWDGHVILQSLNPFTIKPQELIQRVTIPNATLLFDKMGSLSQAHFSNYPPINQLFFLIAAFIGGKSVFSSVLVLKLIIITADIGLYFFGKKLLQFLQKKESLIHLYFLNPLVIIELTGNLHFEGVMLFFFVIGLHFLNKNNWKLSALFIGLSISTKLLPLMLLPIFYNYLGFKKSLAFYCISLLTCFLSFLPFLDENIISNYTNTVGLWFTNFEFNASIYYLLREIGFYVKGYNIIQSIGKITPFVIIFLCIYFSLFRKNKHLPDVLINSLFFLSMYFFISTTVHPWYIVTLILFSVFTNYKYPILWSCLIITSYYAYSLIPFKENLYLIGISYLFVYLYFFYEIFNSKIIFKKG